MVFKHGEGVVCGLARHRARRDRAEQAVGLEDHDLGALAAEDAVEHGERERQALGARGADVRGDAVVAPELEGRDGAVGFGIAKKKQVDGVFRLGEDAVGGFVVIGAVRILVMFG